MLDPTSKSNRDSGDPVAGMKVSVYLRSDLKDPERPVSHSKNNIGRSSRLHHDYPPVVPNQSQRRPVPKNFLLKRLDALYWKRLIRYLYIRFLRMRSSPGAIARGAAAGAFAGSFPFIGLQTILGVAIASCLRGNKVVAAASTFISNPLTYVPLFAFNFHIGRRLLNLPAITVIPASPADIDEWLAMGKGVAAAMMLGSLIVGIVTSLISYYVALQVAQRVQKSKAAKRR